MAEIVSPSRGIRRLFTPPPPAHSDDWNARTEYADAQRQIPRHSWHLLLSSHTRALDSPSGLYPGKFLLCPICFSLSKGKLRCSGVLRDSRGPSGQCSSLDALVERPLSLFWLSNIQFFLKIYLFFYKVCFAHL